MSRSGYNEGDYDPGLAAMWRGAVLRATRGKRGQAMLRELLAALDAMPEKSLIANQLVDCDTGEVCTLGCLGKARGTDMSAIDQEDPYDVAAAFGVATALASEIAYENDEALGEIYAETGPQRWARMRAWVAEQITPSS